MALTLAEMVKTAANNGQELTALIGNYFLRSSTISQTLPWDTNIALAVKIMAWDTLPTIGTRKLNASFSESTGKMQDKIESKYIFGHWIDIDNVLYKANPADRLNQRRMSAEAMAFKFNDMFINGDPQSDEFKGIKDRITDINALGGIWTDQYIDAGSATNGRGMLYSSTERQYFMDNVAKLIHNIVGHKPDYLIMNSKMYLAFEAALRREAVLNQGEDMFGRIINKYQGIPLVDIGIKADQTNEIITNGESLSNGSDETSMYACKFGEGENLWGIQQAPLEVTDLGRVSSSPNLRDEVQWVVGLAVNNPRCLARAYGFVADNGAT